MRVHASGAVTVYTGTVAARPGAGDDAGRRSSPTGSASRTRTSRSSTATPGRPVRPRHLRLALAAPSAARRSPARRRRSSTRRGRSSPTSSRPRRGHRVDRRPFAVKGSPDKGMTIAECAGAAYIPENLPEGMEPGLEEPRSTTRRTSCSRSARTCAWSTSTRRPGSVDIVRYVAVDDCGPAINPKLIDGQVHGGITHAIGQALFERIHSTRTASSCTARSSTTRCRARRRAVVRAPTARRPRRRSTRSASRASGRRARSPPRPAVVNAVIDALRRSASTTSTCR